MPSITSQIRSFGPPVPCRQVGKTRRGAGSPESAAAWPEIVSRRPRLAQPPVPCVPTAEVEASGGVVPPEKIRRSCWCPGWVATSESTLPRLLPSVPSAGIPARPQTSHHDRRGAAPAVPPRCGHQQPFRFERPAPGEVSHTSKTAGQRSFPRVMRPSGRHTLGRAVPRELSERSRITSAVRLRVTRARGEHGATRTGTISASDTRRLHAPDGTHREPPIPSHGSFRVCSPLVQPDRVNQSLGLPSVADVTT